jgi:hypothetical protein
MPLHIFICVDWFLFQEENDFKNYLKMQLEIRNEKNVLPSQLLARRPAAAPPLHLAHSASSTSEPSSSCHAPRNGPAQLSAGRLALLFLWLTPRARLSASSSSTSRS